MLWPPRRVLTTDWSQRINIRVAKGLAQNTSCIVCRLTLGITADRIISGLRGSLIEISQVTGFPAVNSGEDTTVETVQNNLFLYTA